MQHICRQRADQEANSKFEYPPSNEEIEIIGIEIRLPDKKAPKEKTYGSHSTPVTMQEEQLDSNAYPEKYYIDQNNNINNHVCLVRFKGDAGNVSYHMPYVIPLKCIDDYLGCFSPKSRKLIGEYVVHIWEALRVYNGAYWSNRFKYMNHLSQQSRVDRAQSPEVNNMGQITTID